jgi:hypothetical protein
VKSAACNFTVVLPHLEESKVLHACMTSAGTVVVIGLGAVYRAVVAPVEAIEPAVTGVQVTLETGEFITVAVKVSAPPPLRLVPDGFTEMRMASSVIVKLEQFVPMHAFPVTGVEIMTPDEGAW